MKAAILFALLAVAASASPLPASSVAKLANAIYAAEGKSKARVPYGVLSVKVKGRQEARRVVERSVRANWRRWEAAGRPGDFVEFLAKRWAPIGVKNDPNKLNSNWVKNVKFSLQRRQK